MSDLDDLELIADRWRPTAAKRKPSAKQSAVYKKLIQRRSSCLATRVRSSRQHRKHIPVSLASVDKGDGR